MTQPRSGSPFSSSTGECPTSRLRAVIGGRAYTMGDVSGCARRLHGFPSVRFSSPTQEIQACSHFALFGGP